MNDFSNKKLLNSSEKIMLVKIEAKTYLGEGALLENGTLTVPYIKGNLTKIVASYTSRFSQLSPRALIEFTKVDSNPAQHQYVYDEVNKTITLGLAAFTTYYITAHYDLYFTNAIDRVTGKDPLAPNENQVLWKGLLTELPTITIDLSDTIFGTYSLTSSSITIINDGEITSNLTDNDSFHRSPMSIYLAIDGLENVKSIYVGVISDFTVSDDRITFNVKDFIERLNTSALFGDTDTELYQHEIPVPLIYGKASTYAHQGYVYGTTLTPYLNPFTYIGRSLDAETLNVAICLYPEETISTTVNRAYLCCRVKGTENISTTLTGKQIEGPRVSYQATNIEKLTLGDTLNNAANNRYIRIVDMFDGRIVIKTGEYAADPDNGTVFQSNILPTVILSGGEQAQPVIYLAYGKHYTAFSIDTSGGNKAIRIQLNDNFEADAAFAKFFGDSKILDPSKHKVHYKVRPDTTNHKHGTVLKELLTYAGLEVDDASITAANTALNTNVQFQIPFRDESEYNTYLFYVNEILKSTFGIIRSNDQGKIEYKLLGQPSSTDIRDNNDIGLSSFNVSIDYNDLLYGIDAVNKHSYGIDAYNKAVINARNEKARSLHGMDTIIQFEHVLEDISARLPFILAIRSNRNGKYTFTTKNLDLDSLVYDDIKVEREGLLNNQENVNLKITGISKGATNVEIDALDIIGV